MSKISIQLIIGLLALVMKFVGAAIRVVRTIRDLKDDGQLNGSADLPAWLDEVEGVLSGALNTVENMRDNYATVSTEESLEGHA